MGERFRQLDIDDVKELGLYVDACDNSFYAIVEFDDDKPIRVVGVDGGAPEDQSLGRDWSWVVFELNKAANSKTDTTSKPKDIVLGSEWAIRASHSEVSNLPHYYSGWDPEGNKWVIDVSEAYKFKTKSEAKAELLSWHSVCIQGMGLVEVIELGSGCMDYNGDGCS